MIRFPVFLMACTLPFSATAAKLSFTGDARLLDGDKQIYQEIHTINGECREDLFIPKTHSVVYQNERGETFADKELSYAVSSLRPDVDFQQPDFSESLKIINTNDETLSIAWQSPDGDTEKSTLKITDSLVADSGFDNFVRKHWSTVIGEGKTVEFDILAPTRGTAYEFVLEPAKDGRINADHVVRIKPSGTFLGFLVDPIVLGYSDDGLLTHYLGLTNIRKNLDANYTALIRYSVNKRPECELTR